MSEENVCENVYQGDGTLLAGATAYGKTLVTKRKHGFDGFFSIQPVFTGTGTMSIGYQVSNDGIVWSTEISIIAAATTNIVYPYPAAGVNIFAGFQRLVFTETGGANPLTITRLTRCAQ